MRTIAFFTFLSVWAGAAAAFTPGDQRVIDEQVWEPFTKAIIAHDLDGFFSVHSSELIRVEGRGRRVMDFNTYRTAMQNSWSRPPVAGQTFELRFSLRLSNGSSAFETGFFRGVSPGRDGQLRPYYGAFAVTLRKEGDRWKILMDADSFDSRPATEELFLAAQPLTTVPRKGPYLGQQPPGTRPEIFAPGLVSASGRREGGASFSPDGRTLYFTIVAADGSFATHVTRETGEGWTDPTRADFAHEGNTDDVFVTPDGEKLFFASSRPPGTSPTNHRIWSADCAGESWGAPRLLELGIPTNTGVHFPTVSRHGILFVGSAAEMTPDLPNFGKSDLYFTAINASPRSTRNAGPAVNSAHEDRDPFIAPDGSYLLFHSDRPGGIGGMDLWVSFRRADGNWGAPLNLGPEVNSPGAEVGARVTPDGDYLFFERPGRADQDIWWASAEVVTRLKPSTP